MNKTHITPSIIKHELEFLANVSGTEVLAFYSAERDSYVARWNVGDKVVAFPEIAAEDLAKSLNDFSKKYCVPAVEKLKQQ